MSGCCFNADKVYININSSLLWHGLALLVKGARINFDYRECARLTS